ncbi:hypothetical protein, conserved [Eimeria necatrix]|uniref:Uncharacterized protein n=1 Tax=Eimeria necatrix TaxID=51315 RepID=U6N5H9_9EIME|nr:hypothetical protein, conserved [Eimeria necatrix]CDJ70539.1 hypothetical protein, conserved [Eimeria necatrix]
MPGLLGRVGVAAAAVAALGAANSSFAAGAAAEDWAAAASSGLPLSAAFPTEATAAAASSAAAAAAAAAAGAPESPRFSPEEQQVAEVQALDESDLQLQLRALYSVSKDLEMKQIFPEGSLEGMQEVLNELSSVEEQQRDVEQYLRRFALLLGRSLNKYGAFFKLKVALGDPSLKGEAYKQQQQQLPLLAAEWTAANRLLVSYLRLGARDLRDKWGAAAAADKQQQELLQFFERLAAVYEQQQQVFRCGYALAELRYLQQQHAAADLAALLSDSRQKAALRDFEAALETLKENTHLARKAAAKPAKNGLFNPNFLLLLPFPPDKQREADDLPPPEDDEM